MKITQPNWDNNDVNKKEITMFVNNKIRKEEVQRGACPSYNNLNFLATDDNVIVETEAKKDKFVEDSEEPVKDLEQLLCEI